MAILPSTTFADCPPLDPLCVPGGPGQIALMDDEEVLAFLRQMAARAGYVTSVCTGVLVRGAAGSSAATRRCCGRSARRRSPSAPPSAPGPRR
jgi:putative intracellular protease/amidase